MKQAGIVLAALVPLALAGAWWALQEPGQQEPQAQRAGAFAASTAPGQAGGGSAPAGRPRPQAAASDPFLSPSLRHQLDALWLEAGDAAHPAQLKERLLALAPRQFAAADLPRALQLIERYVDYRVAVSALKPPADLSDPHALRQAMQARARVRSTLFAEEEYDALFGHEEALDRYTIARLEVLRNAQLTAPQRQAALREAEHELAEGERVARAESVIQWTVAAQTAAFDSAQVNDASRYAQRRAAYGDEAAQRLARLDAEERDWQGRLAQYAAAKSEALKQQLFTPEEQLRLEAALQLRQSRR